MRAALCLLLLASPALARAETRVEGCVAADAAAIAELVDLELDALALPEAPDVRIECRGVRLLATVKVGERERELSYDEGPDARRTLALEVAETAEMLAAPAPEPPSPRDPDAPEGPAEQAPRRVFPGAGAEAFTDGRAVAAGGLLTLDITLRAGRLDLRLAGRGLAVGREGPGRRGDAGLGLLLRFGREGARLRGALGMLGWVGARRLEANGVVARVRTLGGTLTPWLRVALAATLDLHLGVRLWVGQRIDLLTQGDEPRRGAVWALGPALLLSL